MYGYPILDYNASQKRDQPASDGHFIKPSRLLLCAHTLRTWFDYMVSLPASEFSHFTSVSWGHFVVAIILGLRLSFPMPETCPGWDHAAARGIVDLGSFLEKFSTARGRESEILTPASSKKPTDVMSASKVVIGVVKRKYDKRLEALRSRPPHHIPSDLDKSLNRCPMFDGSLDEYLPGWEDTYLSSAGYSNPPAMAPGTRNGTIRSAGTQPAVFHDLWATMTMGWTQTGFGDVDFGNMD